MKYEPLKLSLENLRKFAESRIELAKEELEKAGYYDDWDNINDLARSKMEAFNLGRNVAMENLMTALLRIVDETEDKIKRHVKSAVSGLLKDIEKLKTEIIDEYKNEWLNTAMKHYCISLLNECKELVKKWFPNAFKEEKR